MNLVLVAYAVPLAAAGIALFSLSVRAVLRARRAATWSVVPAVVTSSRVDTIGLYRTFPVGGVIRTVAITYAYEVNGRLFQGTRLRFGIWRFDGPTTAQLEADRVTYPPGQNMPIYVSPEEPADAVADPAFDQVAVLTCSLLGLLFLAAATWLVAASAGWVTL